METNGSIPWNGGDTCTGYRTRALAWLAARGGEGPADELAAHLGCPQTYLVNAVIGGCNLFASTSPVRLARSGRLEAGLPVDESPLPRLEGVGRLNAMTGEGGSVCLVDGETGEALWAGPPADALLLAELAGQATLAGEGARLNRELRLAARRGLERLALRRAADRAGLAELRRLLAGCPNVDEVRLAGDKP